MGVHEINDQRRAERVDLPRLIPGAVMWFLPVRWWEPDDYPPRRVHGADSGGRIVACPLVRYAVDSGYTHREEPPMTTLLLPTCSKTAQYVLNVADRDDLGATHMITGNTGVTYGRWVQTTGKHVRIPRPGFSRWFGVHGVFYVQETASGDWLPYLRAHATV